MKRFVLAVLAVGILSSPASAQQPCNIGPSFGGSCTLGPVPIVLPASGCEGLGFGSGGFGPVDSFEAVVVADGWDLGSVRLYGTDGERPASGTTLLAEVPISAGQRSAELRARLPYRLGGYVLEVRAAGPIPQQPRFEITTKCSTASCGATMYAGGVFCPIAMDGRLFDGTGCFGIQGGPRAKSPVVVATLSVPTRGAAAVPTPRLRVTDQAGVVVGENMNLSREQSITLKFRPSADDNILSASAVVDGVAASGQPFALRAECEPCAQPRFTYVSPSVTATPGSTVLLRVGVDAVAPSEVGWFQRTPTDAQMIAVGEELRFEMDGSERVVFARVVDPCGFAQTNDVTIKATPSRRRAARR